MQIEKQNLSGIWLKDGRFRIDRLEEGDLRGRLLLEGINNEDVYSLFDENKPENTQGVLQTQISSRVHITLMRDVTLRLKESCNLSGTLTGTIEQASRVVTAIHPNQLNIKGQQEFVLGYEKNSLSVIQSTLDARNHEYLWVYTHPKVLYASNFLQLELLRDSAHFLCCQNNQLKSTLETSKLDFSQCTCCARINKGGSVSADSEEDFILYILGFETFFTDSENMHYSKLLKKGFRFFRTCDDDLIALFKRIDLENKERKNLKAENLEADFNDFFSRNHRKAFWKSFVEYDMFMREYDSKKVLSALCKRATSKTSIYKNNYGMPSKDECEVFRKYGMEDVLILRVDVKTKQLNPNDTLIVFKDQALRLYDVFDKAILREKLSKEFYYLYARMEHKPSDKNIRKLVMELDQLSRH